MAFMADLNRCAELAGQNIWVSDGPDAGSKECVAAVKALTGLTSTGTSLWRRGKKVKGNSILPGTAIATFPLGSLGSFRYKGHAAIFVGYEAGGIKVYDQWGPSPGNQDGKRFGTRIIRYKCGGHVSNDGEALFIIELAEVPSNEPALCGPTSCYSQLTCHS
jgi:hypothetical protein